MDRVVEGWRRAARCESLQLRVRYGASRTRWAFNFGCASVNKQNHHRNPVLALVTGATESRARSRLASRWFTTCQEMFILTVQHHSGAPYRVTEVGVPLGRRQPSSITMSISRTLRSLEVLFLVHYIYYNRSAPVTPLY